jgi:hypothetical protein
VGELGQSFKVSGFQSFKVLSAEQLPSSQEFLKCGDDGAD